MQESIVFLLRVQCRRKESSRSLSHLLMSFLYYNPSTKYLDIASREICVNMRTRDGRTSAGRSDGLPENRMPVGGGGGIINGERFNFKDHCNQAVRACSCLCVSLCICLRSPDCMEIFW